MSHKVINHPLNKTLAGTTSSLIVVLYMSLALHVYVLEKCLGMGCMREISQRYIILYA